MNPASVGVIRHVILDRDGVLNREREQPVRSVEDWQWETGALRGLARVVAQGARLSIVTNQSAIGRGLVAGADVDAVHEWLVGELRSMGTDVVGVFACPHAPDDGCACRKPLPGLVVDAVAASGVPVEQTVLVGDDRRDLDAAAAAGVRAALVLTGKGASVAPSVPNGTDVFVDLDAALSVLLA